MILRFGGKNLLDFDSFDLEFSEGLNVITGETGAGKSILLRGLQALLGRRVELFNNGETWLEALVRMNDVDEELRDLGVREGEHIVSLSAGKRWIYRIDGRMYPQEVVEKLFENMVHFHQQNTHVNLLKRRYQLSLLDRFCDNVQVLSDYIEAYKRLIELHRIVEELSAEDLDRRIEELSGELSFFEKYKPSEDEERTLKERFERVNKAKQIVSLMEEVLRTLDEDLATRLWRLSFSAEKMASLVPKDLPGLLRDVAEKSDEVRALVRRFVDEIQLEDSHEVESRLSIYNELKRRFGPDWENIKKNWAKLEREKSELLESKRRLQLAERELRSIEERCWNLAEKLHENRVKATGEFEGFVNKHLRELAMNLNFSVKIERLNQLTFTGISDVEFVVEASNEQRSLREVLSGGELSRMVLAVHLSVANQIGNVFVFDEIDSGIGGMTGNVLGEKLKSLSKSSQVIVVTHLPQIARHADAHFVVFKEDRNMHVKSLTLEERKDELLRMIGGKDLWGHVV
ncbi:AAA family ATPase [Pseudothermotoga sp.]